jgi:putative endonuclease
MNSRQEGSRGESLVTEYLLQKGYGIRTCNYSCATGEIDIIAEYGDTIVFVEVKARRSQRYGRPAEAVTYGKLKKIERTAQWYLSSARLHHRPARIDVIEVMWHPEGPQITHLENVTG